MNWLVIGVSGVTCGGKTTLANQVNKIFPRSKVISQDDYFLPVDDPKHVFIEELNHINWDILSSLDMDKMYADIQEIIMAKSKSILERKLSSVSEFYSCNLSLSDLQKFILKKVHELGINILIVEGFCILNNRPIEQICNLKYFFTLTKDNCYARRIKRVYEPPDCPGYFDRCVWPEYEKQYDDVKKNVDDVRYFSEFTQNPLEEILVDIKRILSI